MDVGWMKMVGNDNCEWKLDARWMDKNLRWKLNEWRCGWIMLDESMEIATRWLKNLNGGWMNKNYK